MEFLLSLFAFTVLAAETVLSPLADDAFVTPPQSPTVSFGQLATGYVPPVSQSEVLGATTEESAPTEPEAGSGLTTPQGLTPSLPKKSYTIAVLGDSMVDTLGPDFPALKDKLRNQYPTTAFAILNYGVGGTNIDYGIERLTNSYAYMGEQKPSLISQRPNIVIIESFGYNPYPFDEGAIDKHWLALAKIIDTLKANLPDIKIVIAATIAPDAATFGDGAPGVAFAALDKWERVNVIKKYLDNAVRFAQSQKLPLADAFHPSLDVDGNGKDIYINPGDHIHYSDAGRALLAQKIADTIVANKLLE